MGIPALLTMVSNQVIKTADTNHATNDKNRVNNVKVTFFILFSSFAGSIFHTGKKNKLVAKIPIGAANNDSDCSILFLLESEKKMYVVGKIVVGTELIIPPTAPPKRSIQIAITIAMTNPTLADIIAFVPSIESDD